MKSYEIGTEFNFTKFQNPEVSIWNVQGKGKLIRYEDPNASYLMLANEDNQTWATKTANLFCEDSDEATEAYNEQFSEVICPVYFGLGNGDYRPDNDYDDMPKLIAAISDIGRELGIDEAQNIPNSADEISLPISDAIMDVVADVAEAINRL